MLSLYFEIILEIVIINLFDKSGKIREKTFFEIELRHSFEIMGRALTFLFIYIIYNCVIIHSKRGNVELKRKLVLMNSETIDE